MRTLLLAAALLLSFASIAQKVDTPKPAAQKPEQSREELAKMKPEMTEFWDPEVAVVTPGQTPVDAPSDAIVLFDGTPESFNANWTNAKGEPSGWNVAENCVTVVKGAGIIRSKTEMMDFQLHIEWRTPSEVKGESQGRSISCSSARTKRNDDP